MHGVAAGDALAALGLHGYLFFMRASDNLLEISRSVKDGADAAGLRRDLLGGFAAESLAAGARCEEACCTDRGEAFGDGQKSLLLSAFFQHAPMGFLLALPEVIEDNVLRFDDEEELERIVTQCLGSLIQQSGATGVLLSMPTRFSRGEGIRVDTTG